MREVLRGCPVFHPSKSIVVMAQKQGRVVIDETQTKMLEPSDAAHNTPREVRRGSKIHRRLKLPIEATQGNHVAVCIEPPCHGSENLMMPALDMETELLAVFSRKDAI